MECSTTHPVKGGLVRQIEKSDNCYHSFLRCFYSNKLHPDLDIHASWQAEVVEVVDRLGCGVGDVNQALVDTHLERLTASLVYVRAFYYCVATAPRW